MPLSTCSLYPLTLTQQHTVGVEMLSSAIHFHFTKFWIPCAKPTVSQRSGSEIEQAPPKNKSFRPAWWILRKELRLSPLTQFSPVFNLEAILIQQQEVTMPLPRTGEIFLQFSWPPTSLACYQATYLTRQPLSRWRILNFQYSRVSRQVLSAGSKFP